MPGTYRDFLQRMTRGRNGLSRSAALRAATVDAEALLGLADRTGAIASSCAPAACIRRSQGA